MILLETQDERVRPFLHLLAMNTRLVRNCVEGFDESQTLYRITPVANHAAFIVAHLIDARYFLLRVLGSDGENPLASFLADKSTLDELGTFPPMSELLQHWSAVAELLTAHLGGLPSAVLDAKPKDQFPIDDPTALGGLAFLCQHDSYHIGQLALIRRALGFPAMRY